MISAAHILFVPYFMPTIHAAYIARASRGQVTMIWHTVAHISIARFVALGESDFSTNSGMTPSRTATAHGVLHLSLFKTGEHDEIFLVVIAAFRMTVFASTLHRRRPVKDMLCNTAETPRQAGLSTLPAVKLSIVENRQSVLCSLLPPTT